MKQSPMADNWGWIRERISYETSQYDHHVGRVLRALVDGEQPNMTDALKAHGHREAKHAYSAVLESLESGEAPDGE